MQKRPLKKIANLREDETILKIGHYAKGKMVSLGQKLKFKKHAKNGSTIILQFCAKTVRKDTKYLRNRTILKIGYHAKPFAKWSV